MAALAPASSSFFLIVPVMRLGKVVCTALDRAAYEGNSTLDGSGVTVAITDAYAAPTIAGDANKYAGRHGDGTYAKGQFSQVKPGSS